ERHPLPAGQRRPGEAQVDGQPAAPLLGPPVRLHAGQRPHQRRLPVVHVPRGRDHVHALSPSAFHAATTAASRRASCSGETERRLSRRLPFSRRPTTAGCSPRRTASPWRSGAASDSGRLTAALASCTPGAPPPPTAALAATARASTPWLTRST